MGAAVLTLSGAMACHVIRSAVRCQEGLPCGCGDSRPRASAALDVTNVTSGFQRLVRTGISRKPLMYMEAGRGVTSVPM